MSGASSDRKRLSALGFDWWEGLLSSIGAYILSISGTIIASVLTEPDSSLEISLLYGFSSFILLGSAILFLWSKKIPARQFLGSLKTTYLWLVPVFYGGYVILSRIGQAFLDVVPGVDTDQNQDLGFQTLHGWGFVGAFAALIVITPIAEEIIFRGFLYRSLRNPLGKIAAAIITSAIFGAAHGQWNVGVDTFILSLVLIFLVEKSRSLWPAIALHALKNLVAFLLVFVFEVS